MKTSEALAEAVSDPSGHQESHAHVGKSLKTLWARGCVPTCACVCVCVHTCARGRPPGPGYMGTTAEESSTPGFLVVSFHFTGSAPNTRMVPLKTPWLTPQ